MSQNNIQDDMNKSYRQSICSKLPNIFGPKIWTEHSIMDNEGQGVNENLNYLYLIYKLTLFFEIGDHYDESCKMRTYVGNPYEENCKIECFNLKITWLVEDLKI